MWSKERGRESGALVATVVVVEDLEAVKSAGIELSAPSDVSWRGGRVSKQSFTHTKHTIACHTSLPQRAAANQLYPSVARSNSSSLNAGKVPHEIPLIGISPHCASRSIVRLPEYPQSSGRLLAFQRLIHHGNTTCKMPVVSPEKLVALQHAADDVRNVGKGIHVYHIWPSRR